MLNYIWLSLIVLAVAIAGFRDLVGALPDPNSVQKTQSHIEKVTAAAIESTKTAVEIAIGLVGIMALWLGLMRIAEKAGLVHLVACGVRPMTRWLFPEVPADHPAMGSIVMNISANMLGLGNAATPLGIKAMQELQELNSRKDTATNAMCTFLAINTSSVQLIPASCIAILVAEGSTDPTRIIGSAFLATSVSTLVGITSVKLLEKLPMFQLPPEPSNESDI